MAFAVQADQCAFCIVGTFGFDRSVCVSDTKPGDILVLVGDSAPSAIVLKVGARYLVPRQKVVQVLGTDLLGYHFCGHQPLVRLMAVYIEAVSEIIDEIADYQYQIIEAEFLKLCRAAMQSSVRYH